MDTYLPNCGYLLGTLECLVVVHMVILTEVRMSSHLKCFQKTNSVEQYGLFM